MPEQPAPSSPPASGPPPTPPAQLVEHFFRHETGRLHGALIRLLGFENVALAEDVAQEAMLRALRSWSMGGIPANPSAWITRVAMNLAKDALRHRRMSQNKEAAVITDFELNLSSTPPPESTEAEIRDDTLRLMFTCCHPQISADAQVMLCLKMICGFSTAEIARAFFSTDAAVDKNLTRTKQRLREANLPFELPPPAELSERLGGVLSALYLLFNEGYKASAGDQLLREDLCYEAMRLTTLLVSHPVGRDPRCHALLALMLLTAARFPTRTDAQGDLLRLPDQDRTLWDAQLITLGLHHLVESARGETLSEFHLQAGIAACHCTARDYASTDWPRILSHYDALYRLKPSPLIGLNRAVALAQVEGPRAALAFLDALPFSDRLNGHHLLHAVKGELHWQLEAYQDAAENFRLALALCQVGPEQLHLTRMLERLASGPLPPSPAGPITGTTTP